MPTPDINGQRSGPSAEDHQSHRPAADSAAREGGSSRLPLLPERIGQLASAPGTGIALAILVCAAIGVYSLWYVSSGRFPDFPHIQNDYVDLGEAFLHGQTALLETPNPQLATLGNPYDYSQRKNIPVHWDASYYGGRYYLYWGPVPALVSAVLEVILRAQPPASVLVALAYWGLLGIFLALLVQISRHLAGPAPSLPLLPLVIMGFMNLPLLNVIGNPRHYAASILYGQFFLLSGLLGFTLHIGTKKAGWLAMAGLGWGLSLGCRYNLLISVMIYTGFALLWLRGEAGWNRSWKRAGILLAPLTLCVIGLGIYNFVRFDNPLETGLTYQLTIPEFRQLTYSVSYVRSNAYIYLLYPLTSSSSFPFIKSAHFQLSLLPNWLTIPPGRQFDQIIFGVLSSVPGLWLCALAIPLLVLAWMSARKNEASGPRQYASRFLFVMIAAAAAGQFMFLMVFFYATERYVADFYLPVVLCVGMLAWRVDASFRALRPLRAAFWLMVAGLAVWTAGIGYFSCFGVPPLVSNFYDPAMIAKLAAFWNGVHAGIQSVLPRASLFP